MRLLLTVGLGSSVGCASWISPAEPLRFQAGADPPEVVPESRRIDGLTACTPRAPRTVRLDAPVAVLVHGQLNTRGPADRFPALAIGLRQQGVQALCFHYDSTDRLDLAASSLRGSLDALAGAGVRRMKVIGYSLGGLVARRALTEVHPSRAGGSRPTIDLVTVATPFAGIGRANVCGKTWAHVLTLGLTAAICLQVTGHKWRDIPPDSAFIQAPGRLDASVRQHLLVVTKEPRGDRVFRVDEQRQPVPCPRARSVVVEAGHQAVVPLLAALLRSEGLL